MRALVLCLSLVGASLAHAAPKTAASKASPMPANPLLAAADDLLRQVAALRGLRIKAPVARGVLSRSEIGERLRARLDKEYTPAELDAEARVLRRLGLLPVGIDYGRLLVDLLMEQVAGYYDPTARRLYIADWLPVEMQRPALAHELGHALQDQHFDLATFIRPIKDDGDRQLARAALVEGDGTALMLELQAQSQRLPLDQLPDLVAQMGEAILRGSSANDAPLFAGAPTYVRDTMIFPYLEGLRFVMAMRRGRAWSAVDAVWKAPPESTEQILHPDRYLANDAPVKIEAHAISALSPRKEIRRDVLGELGLRILFRSRLPEPQADKAAAGWGGDRLVAYADDRPLPVVLDRSTWDTETDAVEAEAAFAALFAKICGGTTPGSRFVDANGDVWRVERRGKDVLALFGAPKADQPLVDEAWTALTPTVDQASGAKEAGNRKQETGNRKQEL